MFYFGVFLLTRITSCLGSRQNCLGSGSEKLICIDLFLGMNFCCQGKETKGPMLMKYEGVKCSFIRLMCRRTGNGVPEHIRKTEVKYQRILELTTWKPCLNTGAKARITQACQTSQIVVQIVSTSNIL